ncbi:uncharacterized protein LOC100204986 isoform X1 [Hydra vulgaris]|uniref:uncharacterized protein LOC100204986 isoform X1 n=2 Tax=Hydra vulgaris TaxID=6087 RepID=UPI0006416031|nr:uncharacterized protein LOC100204986 isoform X1 [Hydra vulgaris]
MLPLMFIIFTLSSLTAVKRLREDIDCSLYLGFDRYNAEHLYDDSLRENKATLANGALISKLDGSCGVCLQLLDGEVILDGENFKGLPHLGITIALMVNIVNIRGAHELFQTVGSHSDHKEGQYHLEVLDGKVRWFHRNEHGETVFSAETVKQEIDEKVWTELAVTYDGHSGVSKIYKNGIMIKEEVSDAMPLSSDWGLFAGIGNFKGDRELKGYIDEFYIFNRTLNDSEISAIHSHCKGALASQIMHLRFGEVDGNVSIDSSYQGNNGYFVGTVTAGSNGTCGPAVQVATSKLNATSEISLRGSRFHNKPTDACTIALWVKLEDETGKHRLFYTTGGHSMHTHEQYELSVQEGAIYWIHHNEYDQKIFFVKTEPVVVKNEWTHIAATYDSTKEIAVIYVNGDIKEGANGAGALSEDWDGKAAFGKHFGSNEGYDFFDEIEMFSRELSPLEIRQMFMKCSDVLPYGMRSSIPNDKYVHLLKLLQKKNRSLRYRRDTQNQSQLIYMTFDRIAGDKVFDDSGYSNQGSLVGLSKLARDAGKCGHGLRFQGGYILLNGNTIKNKPRTGITISVWVYMDSIEGQQEIFQTIDSKKAVNKHGMYYLEVSNGQLRWFHRNEEGETIFSVETNKKTLLQKEVWVHIGATYDSESKKAIIYGNGEKIQEDDGYGYLSQDWDGQVSIGKFFDSSDSGENLEGREFHGILDEFYIYNRALSQVEISRLSQICDFRRVVLYYSFEKIHMERIYDQSGLSNIGKLINHSDIVDGKCGKGLNFSEHSYISLFGDEFRQKPSNAISVSVWLRLNTNRGRHEIFNTIGSRSLHKHDQYDFAVIDGCISWFHKDHLGKEIFKIETKPVCRPRQWINLIATYDSQEEKAQVYLDGVLVKETKGSGYLSQDWGHFAGIGLHYYENTHLNGAVDELSIFNYALPPDEVVFISTGSCNYVM